MARMLPTLGKVIDVVMHVDEQKLLALCRDCDEELVIISTLHTQVADGNELSLFSNYQCPKCGGVGYAMLRK